ncbi:MAG: hypothetical protein NZ561_09055, partial [Phycisphaerae bacterium]|nr:hypothetical protein [Phycisphaerae bacterium]
IGLEQGWFVMTNPTAGPAELSPLYVRRMTIEELFRNQKNQRNGWSLRDTQITRSPRLDPVLLTLAIAYGLLCGVGMTDRSGHPSVTACSANLRDECRVFAIGRIQLREIAAIDAQASDRRNRLLFGEDGSKLGVTHARRAIDFPAAVDTLFF